MAHLEREAYTSADWHSKEQTDLLGRSWQFACLDSDLTATGDFVSVQVGPYPLMVAKMKDGTLSAYHNVCRHRGTTLVDGKGNAGKSFVCPYHRWTYALDGRLKGAPDMAACFPDLDRKNLSLKPAGLGQFKGLVFINPDPDANFDAWIEPIFDKAWPHELSAKDISEAAPLIYEMDCDWKVFVENAIDGYHLAYLHEKTLGGPKPEENIWEREGPHLLWYATDEDNTRHSMPLKFRKEAKSVWLKPIKAAKDPGYAGVFHLFPTTLIAATPYTFSISTLIPLEAGKCRMEVRHFIGPGQRKDERKHIPGYDSKTGIISSKNWAKTALDTGDFQTEDVWICEKLQRGLNSPAFERGPLAKGAGAEDPIMWFHKNILAVLK